MLLLKYLLLAAGIGLFGAAASVIVFDVVNAVRASQPVVVRWRAASRLAYAESNLPRPVEPEIRPAVVANAFRQTISGYLVRDVFSAKREEVRRAAADAITRRLASDGIVVKEVMLRDVSLPPEYAKGLEGLLIKAQENDRLSIDLEVKQKLVRTAELEADAMKVRHVKEAEG